jgi:hypothetical protein
LIVCGPADPDHASLLTHHVPLLSRPSVPVASLVEKEGLVQVFAEEAPLELDDEELVEPDEELVDEELALVEPDDEEPVPDGPPPDDEEPVPGWPPPDPDSRLPFELEQAATRSRPRPRGRARDIMSTPFARSDPRRALAFSRRDVEAGAHGCAESAQCRAEFALASGARRSA